MMEGLRQLPQLIVEHGIPGRRFALYRSVRKYRPDYLHLDWIHSYYLHRNSLLRRLATLRFVVEILLLGTTRTRIVWTVHNLYPHGSCGGGWQRRLRSWFAQRCEWLRVFDAETAARVEEEFGVAAGRVRIVPEGSYRGYYPDTVDRVTARRSLGIPADRFVFGFIGFIHPYKGVTELLAAFASLPPATRRRSTLLIAGQCTDVDYREELKKWGGQSSEQIHLHLTFISTEELQRYFRASDVVCLPFRKISNSGSTILAMGFGRPIIAPREGAVARRLQQQSQLLYDRGETALRDRMLFASELPPAQLRQWGKDNQRALTRHRWVHFAELFAPVSSP